MVPTLTFQIAFESNPGDDPLVWTTVSGAMSIDYSRGAPNEYGQVETGESTVDIGDTYSALDPNNVGEIVNLVTNPSFEVDTAGWMAISDVTFSRSTADSKYGGASLLVLAAATGNFSRVQSPSVVLTSGDTYTASVWINRQEVLVNLTVDFRVTTTNVVVQSVAVPKVLGWQRVSFTVIATTTAEHDISITKANEATHCSYYLDGVQLEAGSNPSAYCDGDQPNCRWSGTANESASYRGGPYYPNVKRGKAMRAYMTLGGVDYPLFQHFIERLPRKTRIANAWTQREITGVDAFAGFALAGLAGKSYSDETSGSRWGHVLDDCTWAASRRNIDTGNSSLDPVIFAADDTTKALTHLLDVIDNENGFGFMDASGDARFIERHTQITNTTVVATFADVPSLAEYPDAIVYTDLQPESTDIVNDYSGQRALGGGAQTASDATSVAEYGPRSEALTFLVDTDAEVADALAWRLSRTKDPYERVDALTVMPGDDTTKWTTLLGLEIGDRITLVEWAPGFAAPVATDYLIRHLAAHVPTAIQATQFTFQLTPAEQDSFVVLDDATAGQLDANKLAY